jgi:hypothetical protein
MGVQGAPVVECGGSRAVAIDLSESTSPLSCSPEPRRSPRWGGSAPAPPSPPAHSHDAAAAAGDGAGGHSPLNWELSPVGFPAPGALGVALAGVRLRYKSQVGCCSDRGLGPGPGRAWGSVAAVGAAEGCRVRAGWWPVRGSHRGGWRSCGGCAQLTGRRWLRRARGGRAGGAPVRLPLFLRGALISAEGRAGCPPVSSSWHVLSVC